MAQGEFTREEATVTEEAFGEVFKALTKKKQVEYFDHANDIFLFLAAAKRAAPVEPPPPTCPDGRPLRGPRRQ